MMTIKFLIKFLKRSNYLFNFVRESDNFTSFDSVYIVFQTAKCTDRSSTGNWATHTTMFTTGAIIWKSVKNQWHPCHMVTRPNFNGKTWYQSLIQPIGIEFLLDFIWNLSFTLLNFLPVNTVFVQLFFFHLNPRW